VTNSTSTTRNSCSRVYEVFNHPNLTEFGGAALLVDFARQEMRLDELLAGIGVSKADYSTYPLATELGTLIYLRALGIERIAHVDELRHDPLLCHLLGVKQMAHRSTFYRCLDRFATQEQVAELQPVNQALLASLLGGRKNVILDIDTTVNTVYGQQEGACVAYNPRYPGRPSYQPIVAFDAGSGAVVHVELRPGNSPNAAEKVSFLAAAKSQLPEGTKVSFVRADKAFPSEPFCQQLEMDGVGYALKLRMTKGLSKRIERGVLWKRLGSDPNVVIEAGSVCFKASGWSKHRRVVLIRERPTFEVQQRLFSEYAWEYQAIVTNTDWAPETTWHFYNHRCTCENFIKDLKEGVRIDAISKSDFWPNAADLWLKAISHNLLRALILRSPAPYRKYSIRRFRRAFLRVAGVLTYHARRWVIRLPLFWPHQKAWCIMRRALSFA
jgi:hypothetical protein